MKTKPKMKKEGGKSKRYFNAPDKGEEKPSSSKKNVVKQEKGEWKG